MLNKMVIFILFLLLLAFPAFGMEQSFTQKDLTTHIKFSPDTPVAGQEVNLVARVEKGGEAVTNAAVTLEVYSAEAQEPVLKRAVDVLDGDYLDTWVFEKPGEYKVVLNIADPDKPAEVLHYEVKASVGSVEDQAKHAKHGFLEHHFGSKWGWWGGGLMLLMMVLL